MRDRLIELIQNSVNGCARHWAEIIADYLIENGVIVPPDELYVIVDKGTIYATVSKAMVDWLPLYVIKEPEKYGYYRTKEEAEQKLKGGVDNG
jgi:hypothetical protein